MADQRDDTRILRKMMSVLQLQPAQRPPSILESCRKIRGFSMEGSLASEAGLSTPTFHSHFKAITQTSPIQYIKSMRLHQARLLMIRANLTAAAASARVGYESSSQFNREFKRFFGRPSGEELRGMKVAFSLLPLTQLEGIALVH